MPRTRRTVAYLAASEAPARGSDAVGARPGDPVGKRGQLGNHQQPTAHLLHRSGESGGGLLPSRRGVNVAQPVPVVVTCHLCSDPDAGQIVTTAERAWAAAMDHALDKHTAAMIADPGHGVESFTVNSTGRPLPLRPPARTEETR